MNEAAANAVDIGTALSGFFFSNMMKEVIKTMTAVEISEEKLAEEDFKSIKPQLTGVIILSGVKSIMVSLSVSYKTGQAIVSYMTGIQGSEVSENDINDCFSEIANVIGGRIKAKLSLSDIHYNILTPFTINGDGHYISPRNNSLLMTKVFHNCDIQIVARVYAL